MSYWQCSLCPHQVPLDMAEKRIARHEESHTATTFKDGRRRWNIIGKPEWTLITNEMSNR